MKGEDEIGDKHIKMGGRSRAPPPNGDAELSF